MKKWLWLEGDLKDHQAPTPLPWAGKFLLDCVAQSPIHTCFEHIQEWGNGDFLQQPIPVPHQPHSREFIPNI